MSTSNLLLKLVDIVFAAVLSASLMACVYTIFTLVDEARANVFPQYIYLFFKYVVWFVLLFVVVYIRREFKKCSSGGKALTSSIQVFNILLFIVHVMALMVLFLVA